MNAVLKMRVAAVDAFAGSVAGKACRAFVEIETSNVLSCEFCFDKEFTTPTANFQ
jgi:hypothetical protein